MKNYVKEAWVGLPKGVKTGLKVVAGVAVVAAVGFAANEGYKRYYRDGEKSPEQEARELEDELRELEEMEKAEAEEQQIEVGSEEEPVVVVSE